MCLEITYLIWVSRGYVATLLDELKHILFGVSETTAHKFHTATAHNQSGAKCILQQLQTARVTQDEDSLNVLYTLRFVFQKP